MVVLVRQKHGCDALFMLSRARRVCIQRVQSGPIGIHTWSYMWVDMYVYIYISIFLNWSLGAQCNVIGIELCMTVGSSQMCFTMCKCYWCLTLGRCCIYICPYIHIDLFISKPTGQMLKQWCRNRVVHDRRDLWDVLHSVYVLLVPHIWEVL